MSDIMTIIPFLQILLTPPPLSHCYRIRYRRYYCTYVLYGLLFIIIVITDAYKSLHRFSIGSAYFLFGIYMQF